MRFIGIDLAWTYKNETGLCVLDQDGTVLLLDSKVYTDDQLADLIEHYAQGEAVIGIDAPLIVKNQEGSRDAERQLMKTKIHGHRIYAFITNRSFMLRTFKQLRGETLVGHIQERLPEATYALEAQDQGVVVQETFPTGICCGLFPDAYPIRYKIKGKVPFETTKAEMVRLLDLLKGLEEASRIRNLLVHLDYQPEKIKKKDHKHLEDKVDAFLCAYGLMALYKKWAKPLTFGDLETGFFTLPMGERTMGAGGKL